MVALRIVQYIIWAFIDTSFGMIARVFFNWWVPIFASEDGWLPNWLKWFQTFDAPLDAGWRDGYRGFPTPTTKWQRYKLRVKWLYRNTAYGFSYWVMGIKFDPSEWTVKRFVNTPELSNFVAVSSKGYFNFTYHGKWGEYKLGWKAWNYFDANKADWKNYPWGPVWRTQCVFTPNPFKRRKPK